MENYEKGLKDVFNHQVDLSDITMKPDTWMQIRIPIKKSEEGCQGWIYGILEITAFEDEGVIHIRRTEDIPDFETFDSY